MDDYVLKRDSRNDCYFLVTLLTVCMPFIRFEKAYTMATRAIKLINEVFEI